MNRLLTAKGIRKVFMKDNICQEVLKGINLEVREGDLITIMGPSGAGKSTFLHILGLIDRPSQGELYYRDKDTETLGERELSILRNEKIGFVFQFYHLLHDLTVKENVLLPLLIKGIDRKRASSAVEEVLELLGLRDKMRHFPSELSGGERQRVAIARAIANRPEIVLADEPTGNLDRKTGYEILDYLLSLNGEFSYALVIVTHDPYIGSLGKRRYRMTDGELFED